MISVTHEIGHTFGAAHDCELPTNDDYYQDDTPTCSAGSSGPCVPNDDVGGAFIMFPTIKDLSDQATNNHLFSPCSLVRMQTMIAAKGSCLLGDNHTCAAVGSCCTDKVPFPVGSDCAGQTGTCGALGVCEVCSTPSSCTPAPPLAAQPGCEYVAVTSPGLICSDACGDSNRTVLKVCSCNGVASSSPEACGGVPQYGDSVTCRVATCDPTAPHYVNIELDLSPGAFDAGRVESQILMTLALHVQVHHAVSSKDGRRTALQLKR